jgi:hypothetical protein
MAQTACGGMTMNRREKVAIRKWASTLTDEQLEDEYYRSVIDSLGSEAEEMYELGYDIVDIKAQEEHEKYLSQKSDILASICEQRGIKLWEEKD